MPRSLRSRAATYATSLARVPVQSGDLLILCLDGIVEAAKASEEEFGEERLRGIIPETCARPAAEILDEILKQVRAFIQEAPPQDDMTLVAAHINETGEQAGMPSTAAPAILRYLI